MQDTGYTVIKASLVFTSNNLQKIAVNTEMQWDEPNQKYVMYKMTR